MIHLEPGNRIVAEAVHAQLHSEEHVAVDVAAADHNDVLYKITSDPSSPHILLVSVTARCFAQVLEQVGFAFFRSRLGSCLRDTPEPGTSLTVELDLSELASAPEERKEELARLVSCLRRDIEGAPLWVCYDALLNGRPVPLPCYVVHFRPREAMYVVPAPERIITIFVLTFDDPTEQALAAVFLQEMEVVRRNDRTLASAPIVAFSFKPPHELQQMLSGADGPDAPLGYLSIALDKRHLEGPGRLEKAVGLVSSYRSYVMYHVKASKSNMHSQMRARVNTWLQVLNRAKPDRHAAEKKTVTGRTFKRAGSSVSSIAA